MLSKRRKLREKVLQALYAYEISQDPIDKIKNDLLKDICYDDNINFANKLIDSVIANKSKFDELISSTLEHWELDKIALLDSIIIKMCLSEFLFFEEIPTKVSINEAIDLAKTYSTTNSGRFVNGILDSLLMQLKGEIVKKGKGLVTTSKKQRS